MLVPWNFPFPGADNGWQTCISVCASLSIKFARGLATTYSRLLFLVYDITVLRNKALQDAEGRLREGSAQRSKEGIAVMITSPRSHHYKFFTARIFKLEPSDLSCATVL